jgi:hypothetical protein
MLQLLLETKQAVEAAHTLEQAALSTGQIAGFVNRYNQIVAEGLLAKSTA